MTQIKGVTYNPDTGVLIGLKGQPIGFHDAKGYIRIKYKGKNYLAHRVAWFLQTGEWPTNQIDHKNRVRDDNRWDNLREADQSTQSLNQGLRKDNTSGYKGVRYDKSTGKWIAQYKNIYLGLFKTPEEANNERTARAHIGD